MTDSTTPSGRTIVALLAVVKLAIHLSFNRGYGYFRDELYFFACGDRLDWGYADHPPLVALAARIPRMLLGDSLWSVRLLPAIAGAALVLVTGRIVRELGGGRFAQALAAVAVIVTPVYLAQGNFLSMNAFEPLIWMSFALVVILLVKGGDPKWWLAAGAIAGIGMQNKYSMAFFGASVVIGLIVTPERRILFTPWVLAGGAVTLAVWLPNLLWNVAHNWPILEILHNVEQGKNVMLGPLEFFQRQFGLMNPFASPLWVAGVLYLLIARDVRAYRALGVAYIALFVILSVLHGKDYYLAPVYPMLIAAGAIATERLAERRRLGWLRQATIAVVVVGGLISAPFVLPVLSVDRFVAYEKLLGHEPPKTENQRWGRLPQLYADQQGWHEIVGAVADAYNGLPPDERARAAIYAQNYGEAGAIDFFGPSLGLPKAISGHQNYYLWGPRGADGDVLVTLGFDHEDLKPYFETVDEAARVHCGDCMPYEDDNPVYICRRPIAPLWALWPLTKEWE